jgi:hypothetical protein
LVPSILENKSKIEMFNSGNCFFNSVIFDIIYFLLVNNTLFILVGQIDERFLTFYFYPTNKCNIFAFKKQIRLVSIYQ